MNSLIEMKLKPEKDEQDAWWKAFLIIGGLMVGISAPKFLTNPLFGDDWVWYWLYHAVGPSAVQERMGDVAHPGFGPLFNLMFSFSGGYEGTAAIAISLIAHIVNGFLLGRILLEGRATASLSVCAAVLYILSPYMSVRGNFSHTPYDVFVLFYFLSILWSRRDDWLSQGGSLFMELIALSIETLAVFEVLRWWVLYQKLGYPAVKRSMPFLMIVVVVAILRMTWIVPSAGYANYNSIRTDMSVLDVLWLVKMNIIYFFAVLKPSLGLGSLVRTDPIWLITILIIGAIFASVLARMKSELDWNKCLKLFCVGLIIFAGGMLPYIAIDRVPTATSFTSSRFAVITEVGVMLMGVALLHFGPLIPRVVAVALTVCVFALLQLQSTKWLLFDQILFRQYQSQVQQYFAGTDNEGLLTRIEPSGSDILFQYRCLAGYDLSARLDIMGARRHNFARDVTCYRPDAPKAQMRTTIDCAPPSKGMDVCIKRVLDARFRIHQGAESFMRFSAVQLVRAQWAGEGLEVGSLVVLGERAQ